MCRKQQYELQPYKIWTITFFCYIHICFILCRLKNNSFQIITGTVSLSEGGDVYDVAELIYHEEYDDLEVYNDIGLIKTKQAIIFNKNVKPIALGM